jgi:hypothetical protein
LTLDGHGQLHEATDLPPVKEYRSHVTSTTATSDFGVTPFITWVLNSCGATPVAGSTTDTIIVITHSIVIEK